MSFFPFICLYRIISEKYMKIALKIQPEIRQDDVYTTEVIY